MMEALVRARHELESRVEQLHRFGDESHRAIQPLRLHLDFLAEQTFDDQGRVTFQRVGDNFINRFTYDDATRTTIVERAKEALREGVFGPSADLS